MDEKRRRNLIIAIIIVAIIAIIANAIAQQQKSPSFMQTIPSLNKVLSLVHNDIANPDNVAHQQYFIILAWVPVSMC